MQWDHEVDLVSVGSGAGALAAAIVAVDGGQTVFAAQSAPRDQRSHRRLGIEIADSETNAYLDAVIEVAGTEMPDMAGPDLPVRFVTDPVPPSLGCNRRRAMIEPFVGARLGNWAADCVTASHAVLYSHVTGRNMTTMRSTSGEKLEAAVVGSVEPGVFGDEWSLDHWLSAEARSRGIDFREDSSLERLVFDDGMVVGAVVMTPDGACAISARRGVVVATGGSRAVADRLPDETAVRVGVVSKTASRFGRVELLARERAGSRLAAWTATGSVQPRQLRSHPLNSRGRCHSISPGQLHDGSL